MIKTKSWIPLLQQVADDENESGGRVGRRTMWRLSEGDLALKSLVKWKTLINTRRKKGEGGFGWAHPKGVEGRWLGLGVGGQDHGSQIAVSS